MNLKQKIVNLLLQFDHHADYNPGKNPDIRDLADQIDTLYRNKMLEVIGEDEKLVHHNVETNANLMMGKSINEPKVVRNNLRAKLRQAIKGESNIKGIKE